MFVILHEYSVDGGYGDCIGTIDVIGFVQTKEEAKAYCDKHVNPHDYDNPDAYLICGTLYYNEVPLIDDLDKPPHKYNENARWAFDKNCDKYNDLNEASIEDKRLENAIRSYREQGMPLKAIAEKLDVSESYVRIRIDEIDKKEDK